MRGEEYMVFDDGEVSNMIGGPHHHVVTDRHIIIKDIPLQD